MDQFWVVKMPFSGSIFGCQNQKSLFVIFVTLLWLSLEYIMLLSEGLEFFILSYSFTVVFLTFLISIESMCEEREGIHTYIYKKHPKAVTSVTLVTFAVISMGYSFLLRHLASPPVTFGVISTGYDAFSWIFQWVC